MANMVFDSDDPGDPMAQGASPITWTHTNSGTPTIGIVTVQVNAYNTGFGSVSAVTWDGETCDLRGSEQIQYEGDPFSPGEDTFVKCWLFTIQDPGTGTVSVSHNDVSAGIWSAGSVAYTGGGVKVDLQTATIGPFEGPDTQTIEINLSGSDADGVSVDSLALGGTPQGSGQSELMARPFFGRMSHVVGGATPFNPNMGWLVSSPGANIFAASCMVGILFVDAAEGLLVLPGQEISAAPIGGQTAPNWNLPYPPFGQFDKSFAYNSFKTNKGLIDRYKNVKIF